MAPKPTYGGKRSRTSKKSSRRGGKGTRKSRSHKRGGSAKSPLSSN